MEGRFLEDQTAYWGLVGEIAGAVAAEAEQAWPGEENAVLAAQVNALQAPVDDLWAAGADIVVAGGAGADDALADKWATFLDTRKRAVFVNFSPQQVFLLIRAVQRAAKADPWGAGAVVFLSEGGAQAVPPLKLADCGVASGTCINGAAEEACDALLLNNDSLASFFGAYRSCAHMARHGVDYCTIG